MNEHALGILQKKRKKLSKTTKKRDKIRMKLVTIMKNIFLCPCLFVYPSLCPSFSLCLCISVSLSLCISVSIRNPYIYGRNSIFHSHWSQLFSLRITAISSCNQSIDIHVGQLIHNIGTVLANQNLGSFQQSLSLFLLSCSFRTGPL